MVETKKLPYLNLGCGKLINDRWRNVDMAPTVPGIEVHDLTKKLPFADQSFKVVYHSHVLEHIPKEHAKSFMDECYRLLEVGGVVRVVVPDLEMIVRSYLKFLEENLKAPNEVAAANYDWMMIEMFDQVVRHQSGGHMMQYLKQPNLPNWSFLETRSSEARRVSKNEMPPKSFSHKWNKFKQLNFKTKIILLKGAFKQMVFNLLPGSKYYKVGAFRLGGEVHQWMYDQYSLTRLLQECGFKQISIKTAFDSNIDDWTSFDLDSKDGVVLKPDSLFIEGIR